MKIRFLLLSLVILSVTVKPGWGETNHSKYSESEHIANSNQYFTHEMILGFSLFNWNLGLGYNFNISSLLSMGPDIDLGLVTSDTKITGLKLGYGLHINLFWNQRRTFYNRLDFLIYPDDEYSIVLGFNYRFEFRNSKEWNFSPELAYRYYNSVAGYSGADPDISIYTGFGFGGKKAFNGKQKQKQKKDLSGKISKPKTKQFEFYRHEISLSSDFLIFYPGYLRYISNYDIFYRINFTRHFSLGAGLGIVEQDYQPLSFATAYSLLVRYTFGINENMFMEYILSYHNPPSGFSGGWDPGNGQNINTGIFRWGYNWAVLPYKNMNLSPFVLYGSHPALGLEIKYLFGNQIVKKRYNKIAVKKSVSIGIKPPLSLASLIYTTGIPRLRWGPRVQLEYFKNKRMSLIYKVYYYTQYSTWSVYDNIQTHSAGISVRNRWYNDFKQSNLRAFLDLGLGLAYYNHMDYKTVSPEFQIGTGLKVLFKNKKHYIDFTYEWIVPVNLSRFPYEAISYSTLFPSSRYFLEFSHFGINVDFGWMI